MAQTLKEKTISGVLWSIIDKLGVISVKFIVGVILSRILLPSDFGTIGMVAILFDVASELGVAGFGQAYIQKVKVNKYDIATVFYLGLVLSIFFYLSFWFLSPAIASFYNQPVLESVIKILALVVVIDSFRAIRVVDIIRRVDFKKITIANFISGTVSGVIAIYLASSGFGVWALVVYALAGKVIVAGVLWYKVPLISISDFSIKSLRSMFSFSSWILAAIMLRRVTESINILIIGKFFPVAYLGFYTKAKQYQDLTVGQVTQGVSSVVFPVLASVNTDKESLKKGVMNFLQQTLFVVMPVAVVLFVSAKPFVILLLTEKWAPMIIFLKLFCIVGIVFPVNSINTQLLIAQGHGRENFILVLIKNALRLLNIVVCYRYGVIYIVIGEIVISFVSLFVNTYYTSRNINYSLFSQLYDVRFILLGGVLALIAGAFANRVTENLYIMLMLGGGSSVIVFYVVQYLFNRKVLVPVMEQLKKLVNRLRL